MNNGLDKLWHDYFSEICAAIETEEEKKRTKIAVELHERANELLDEHQKAAVERYVDALCDVEALFAQKAFLKGCQFAALFLVETRALEK